MKALILLALAAMTFTIPVRTHAQSQEAQQLLLNWEKLVQFKSILKNMYDGYKVVSQGYDAIRNISQGNFSLHQTFLNQLLVVSPAIRKYSRIADIISYQQKIIKEYKAAFNFLKRTGSFNSGEISYIEKVYKNLFQSSLKNLDALLIIVTSGKLRMDDEERLQAIDTLFSEMQDKLLFLRSFNNEAKLLAMQKMKDQTDVDLSRKLNQIK